MRPNCLPISLAFVYVATATYRSSSGQWIPAAGARRFKESKGKIGTKMGPIYLSVLKSTFLGVLGGCQLILGEIYGCM